VFKRPHHQRIVEILRTFNAPLLERLGCYFGGGTAIALALNEYRESVDIDFLCSSYEGYRELRSLVGNTINPLLTTPLLHAREVRTDAYKIITVLELEGVKIKVELVREARIQLSGNIDPVLGVPVLCNSDLFAEKLLANADRGMDKQTCSRDIIDLAMMVAAWGGMQHIAWEKAVSAYGEALIDRSFQRTTQMISDPKYLASCLYSMQVDPRLHSTIVRNADQMASKLPLNPTADAQRHARIQQFASLERAAGATYTLWKIANENSIHGLENVDWADVENKTIKESMSVNGQSADAVFKSLVEHSPGLISHERQKIVEMRIDDLSQVLIAGGKKTDGLGASRQAPGQS
jgi:hypothetical protein